MIYKKILLWGISPRSHLHGEPLCSQALYGTMDTGYQKSSSSYTHELLVHSSDDLRIICIAFINFFYHLLLCKLKTQLLQCQADTFYLYWIECLLPSIAIIIMFLFW